MEIERNEIVNNGEALYDVLLTDCGVAKLSVVKVVKELTGLGLKEAKDLTDNIPSVIAEGISEDKAYMIAANLEDAGATASVREHKE